MKLAVIIGTTREGRQTERLAKWVVNGAKEQAGTEVTLLDLKEFPMPFFDEPMSPRFNPNRKINEVAQKWLAELNKADAFVFVTPEYNHSIPGVLKNALDYSTWELKQKPATVVSHGTVGGARAAMHLKEIISESRAVPIPSHVAFLPRVGEKIDDNGRLDAELKALEYGPQTALNNMLEELKWYSDVLATARSQAA
jgi:NAD(P)H-dependent FMN reductase